MIAVREVSQEVTERGSTTAAPETLVVETHGLTKRYGKRIVAVDDLSMTVRRGEVYGFLGPNGAGKTTTIRMILGLIRPTAGSGQVLGERLGSPAAMKRIGALVETPALYPYLSGRDNLRALARYNGASDRKVEEVLDTVGLQGRASDKFGVYSLGMKQRLGIAAALLKDPDLLLLDEPTNGLDPQGVVEMRNLVRGLGSAGKTLLISSHLLTEVEQVADRVGIIQRGHLVAEGVVDELRQGGGLSVRAQPAALAHRVLDKFGEVSTVRRNGESFHVNIAPVEAPRINRALVEAGVDVYEVRPVERSLEEVFLKLTDDNREVQ